MSGLSDGLDQAVSDMYEAADVMLLASSVFPLCDEIDKLMGMAEGSPGALAEGANNWSQGAQALQQAQQAVTSICSQLGSYDWSGDDRDAFNTDVQQLAAQLGDNHNYANAVAGTLAALSVPFGVFPGVCVGIGAMMLSFSVAFEAAAASIVGDFGASESIYAAGTEASVTAMEIVTTSVEAITAMCAAAAAVLLISDVADIHALENNGDSNAGKDFAKAEVNSLGDVAKNLEGFAVSQAADHIADKATDGMPTGDVADKATKAFVKDELGNQIENDNKGAVDLVTGEDPSKTIADTLGVSPEVFEPEPQEDACRTTSASSSTRASTGANSPSDARRRVQRPPRCWRAMESSCWAAPRTDWLSSRCAFSTLAASRRAAPG